ncbi:MAG: hypothetical protein ABWY25_07560 [Paenisporosarcina sp.]
MKAVKITKENQVQLATRYGEDDLEQFPIGYIMIANWGDNGEYRYEGVLTEVNFSLKFVKGEALENGFFAISRKPVTRGV